MLQLLPLTVTEDAQALADDALAAAGGRSRRMTVHRPLPQTVKLLRSSFSRAPILFAVGEAVAPALWARVPIVYVPNGQPTAAEAMTLKRLRTVHLLASSQLAATRLHRFGFRFASTTIVRPDTKLPRRRDRRDEMLRDELGVQPSDRLVCAPGPTGRDSGHLAAMWATAILSFATGGQWKLLISGDGAGVSRLIHFANSNQPSALLLARDLLTDFTPEAGFAAADLAVDFGTGPGDIRPILQAQALGVPLLVSRRSAAAEVVGPEAISPELTPRVLARKFMEAAGSMPADTCVRDTAIPAIRRLLQSLQLHPAAH